MSRSCLSGQRTHDRLTTPSTIEAKTSHELFVRGLDAIVYFCVYIYEQRLLAHRIMSLQASQTG